MMKLIKRLLLISSIVLSGSISAETKNMLNQVSTVGTLHDLHLENSKYGLKELISSIEQFKPDVILTEVRPEYPSVAEASIDGGIEQSIIFAYGSINSIPIIPTDWFTDDYFQLMQTEGEKVDPKEMKTLDPLFDKYRASFTTASFLELNSEENKKLVREIYAIQEKLGMKASKMRNDKICKNIKEAISKYSNKRILVVYGMDHKYYIDDYISSLKTNNQLMSVSLWFDINKVKSFQISKEFRSQIILNLNASKSLLTKRIETNYYPKLWGAKVAEKLKQFSKWEKAIGSL